MLLVCGHCACSYALVLCRAARAGVAGARQRAWGHMCNTFAYKQSRTRQVRSTAVYGRASLRGALDRNGHHFRQAGNMQ